MERESAASLHSISADIWEGGDRPADLIPAVLHRIPEIFTCVTNDDKWHNDDEFMIKLKGRSIQKVCFPE